MSFPCSLTFAGSHEIKTNPQHCIKAFHVLAIPRPPHPPFLCCDWSRSTLSTLKFFPWSALLCVAKSHSIFKTQTKHHLTLSHPLPTLMVLRTSTTSTSTLFTCKITSYCNCLYLYPSAHWFVSLRARSYSCLYPHHPAQCLPILKMLKELCNHIWKCKYMKEFWNWKPSLK